ncbi:MAG: DUF885 family protein [Sphingomonadales bacterium]
MKYAAGKIAASIVLAASLGLGGCDGGQDDVGEQKQQARQETAAVTQSESERLSAFFEEAFQTQLDRSPIFQSYLGIKKDYDKWDDFSDRQAVEDNELTRQYLERLRAEFDFGKLDEASKLSYRLFEEQAEQQLTLFSYRFHSYPVNQMFGWQSQIPSLLINIHRIDTVEDAEAYVTRLNGVTLLIDQIIEGLDRRAEIGIDLPKFVFAHALRDIGNVIQGAPFDDSGEDSTLLADFTAKVGRLEIEAAERDRFIEKAAHALKNSFQPAYQKLAGWLTERDRQVEINNGAWALPDGAAFYALALKQQTTTDMSAEAIHALGLSEVARIQDEMRTLMKQVKFQGSLRDFFEFMQTDSQFYYPQTDEGKQAYLERADQTIAAMKARLDDFFGVKPKADLVVKAVEPFREKSAGVAFYQQPAPDGSRPGTYYANTYKMQALPIYELESLAFHEGIPGHHMQLAIAQELEGLPKFRKFGGYTAYIEGWGLYSEYLGKEMGFYQDPYSDFGRLSMELLRAVRLVADTGIHAKRWSREQTIRYLVENLPNSEAEATKSVERYFIMPGQATAYKIGMLKILELRRAAHERLGDAFDVRGFHDVVLKNGAVPLTVLDELVKSWVQEQLPS